MCVCESTVENQVAPALQIQYPSIAQITLKEIHLNSIYQDGKKRKIVFRTPSNGDNLFKVADSSGNAARFFKRADRGGL